MWDARESTPATTEIYHPPDCSMMKHIVTLLAPGIDATTGCMVWVCRWHKASQHPMCLRQQQGSWAWTPSSACALKMRLVGLRWVLGTCECTASYIECTVSYILLCGLFASGGSCSSAAVRIGCLCHQHRAANRLHCRVRTRQSPFTCCTCTLCAAYS